MERIYRYERGAMEARSIPVVEEAPLTVLVNGFELLTFLCSPADLEDLVLGFLYHERLLTGLDGLASLEIDTEQAIARVELIARDFVPPKRRVFTSGCGGGLSFHLRLGDYPPLYSRRTLAPEAVYPLLSQLFAAAVQYRRSRGIHAAALSDGSKLLLVREDVGRHNALDKIQGAALRSGISTRDCILLSSGRISSEMLRKGARMEVPFLISRTSPTTLAIENARRLGITLIGYARPGSFNVYSHPERLDYQRSDAATSFAELPMTIATAS